MVFLSSHLDNGGIEPVRFYHIQCEVKEKTKMCLRIYNKHNQRDLN